MKAKLYYCSTITKITLFSRPLIRNGVICKIELTPLNTICLKECFNQRAFHSTPIPCVRNFKLSHTGLNSHLKSIFNDYMNIKRQTTNQGNEGRNSILLANKMEPLVHVIQEVWEHNEEVTQLEQLITELKTDNSSSNAEMIKLATEDLNNLQRKEEELKEKLLPLLLPKEPTDHMNILLELGAGAGGQEAMLFTLDLLTMYTNYAEWKGWDCQLLDYSESDLGGMRHATLSMAGEMVGETMKFESGVHRVQRVPKTEKAGRIHTSTTTVAVLPTPTELEVHINPKDLTMETKRASGPGGQHVNKTESAVRITHIPTGIIVECQKDRSQIKNRELAIQILRARIFDRKQREQLSKHYTEKKMQVGSGDRAEKVRTYNYNQDRITDHRLGTTYHNLVELFKGREHLDDILKHLRQTEQEKRLQAVLENNGN